MKISHRTRLKGLVSLSLPYVLPPLVILWFGTRIGQLWGAPPNDAIADRIVLHGEDFTISGSLDGATLETATGNPGEVQKLPEPELWGLNNLCEFDPSDRAPGSVWYEWVAPSDGTVVMIPVWSAEEDWFFCNPTLLCWTTVDASPDLWPADGFSVGSVCDYCGRSSETARYPFGGCYVEAGRVYLFEVYGRPQGEFRFRCVISRGPFIAEQPIDRDLLVGETSFLSVVATGSVDPDRFPRAIESLYYSPLVYQWYRGGEVMEGQTNSTLLIRSNSLVGLDQYCVAVTDRAGTVISRIATVRVNSSERAPRLMLERMGGSTNEWLCRLEGERGRFYSIHSSTNLVDWEDQAVSLAQPWLNEVAVVTGNRPRLPRQTPNHVQLEGLWGEFVINSSGARRYFRANRMTPLHSFRSSALWMIQYAKEDRARHNLARRGIVDDSYLSEVAHRLPDDVRAWAEGRETECRASVILGPFYDPPKWPCISFDPVDWADPYQFSNPALVWKLRRGN